MRADALVAVVLPLLILALFWWLAQRDDDDGEGKP
jgi:hypothetical protein